MIKFCDCVPSVYPNASRDFQFLSRLIDIVLNSVKHNVDDVYDLPNSAADHKLTELLAMTLGFKVKRNYDKNQLRALVAALPRILKYKGTKTAVDMAGNALISASGASGDFLSEIVDGELKVYFPLDLVDITLFTDLLDYILPAGMTYHLVRENRENRTHETKLSYDDRKLLASFVPDVSFDADTISVVGLSSMFDQNNSFTLANFIDSNISAPNVGLLDNSIIPMLIYPLVNNSEYTTELNSPATAELVAESAEKDDDTTNSVILK